MQLQSKIPVKKTKIIACICLIVLIVLCSVLSNKEISKHKNDSSQNVSDDINIQKKTTIETSELQEKKSDIFVPSTDDKTVDVSSDNNIVSQYAVLVNADDGTITASKNANEKMYPASMTKVMAAIFHAAMENEICKKVLSARNYTTSCTQQHAQGIIFSSKFLNRTDCKFGKGKVVGAKTGYVNQSRYCAVSMYESESNNKYICVTGMPGKAWQTVYDHIAFYPNYCK